MALTKTAGNSLSIYQPTTSSTLRTRGVHVPLFIAQAKIAPAKPTAPSRYMPTRSVQVRTAFPGCAAPPTTGHLVIQRMEGCVWCSIRGCHGGSICKATGSHPGTYNARTQDQEFLSSQFGQPVSGDTHQMEHAFGYDVLARPLGVKRGSTPLAQRIEKEAPAYHEEKEQHRKHEGTGNLVKSKRESGLNAPEYRSWQRTALKDGNPDIAIATNQMTYGHQQLKHDAIGQEQAYDSFFRMVKNMDKIPFANDNGQFEYLPAPTDDMKFDMAVARFMATFHRVPSDSEQMEIARMLGINPSWY